MKTEVTFRTGSESVGTRSDGIGTRSDIRDPEGHFDFRLNDTKLRLSPLPHPEPANFFKRGSYSIENQTRAGIFAFQSHKKTV